MHPFWHEMLNAKDPLIALRQKAWDLLEKKGFPNLSFKKLAERKTSLPPKPDGDIVFVDGFFEESLSSLPPGVVCLGLDQAIRLYGLFLQQRLSFSFKEEKDSFALLNGAFHGRGVFLYVPPKLQIEKPIRVVHIYTGDGLANPRLQVSLGKGAKLEIIQEAKQSLCNHCMDIVLDEGARFQLTDRGGQHVQSIRAAVKRDASLKAVFLNPAERTNVQVQLLEENSEVELLGLAKLSGEMKIDTQILVEHKAAHTRSRQHFKNVLFDKARSCFEGKIFVFPEAQKTESYQLNNNLVLSDEAVATSQPNLEIFADDVKASHGATFGQLDLEQLFYLRSRGLSIEQAKKWLVDGFCEEILTHAR